MMSDFRLDIRPRCEQHPSYRVGACTPCAEANLAARVVANRCEQHPYWAEPEPCALCRSTVGSAWVAALEEMGRVAEEMKVFALDAANDTVAVATQKAVARRLGIMATRMQEDIGSLLIQAQMLKDILERDPEST